MTTKVPSSPPSPQHKARVLRLVPTIDKPLSRNCLDVTTRLKRALATARVGRTSGAVIIELDNHGNWSVDIAGKLAADPDTLFLIAGRVFGACLSSS
jgi:hypothetical protein